MTPSRSCAGASLTADTLIAAATNDPSADTVTGFQAAVRSRYAETDWLTVVKPVNDTMRQMRRDALVAYILLHLRPGILSQLGVQATASRSPPPTTCSATSCWTSQMQPCMETSRIRHALSSVQLFIERCLRNLEPPSTRRHRRPASGPGASGTASGRPTGRYSCGQRTGSTPALRDDQSPFFKTTMKQLLQSDITDDTAAGAYLDYLTSLEQVAKLEPCGLYYAARRRRHGSDVAHVIARTAGAHRKYYYRRFQQGAWTPWEEIKLSIEDNPVVPYVWNGRLLLFWLQIQHSPRTDPASRWPEPAAARDQRQSWPSMDTRRHRQSRSGRPPRGRPRSRSAPSCASASTTTATGSRRRPPTHDNPLHASTSSAAGSLRPLNPGAAAVDGRRPRRRRPCTSR